jgi:hypothetical protein
LVELNLAEDIPFLSGWLDPIQTIKGLVDTTKRLETAGPGPRIILSKGILFQEYHHPFLGLSHCFTPKYCVFVSAIDEIP